MDSEKYSILFNPPDKLSERIKEKVKKTSPKSKKIITYFPVVILVYFYVVYKLFFVLVKLDF